MKISDMPTAELRRAAQATEQVLGPTAYEVQALRRELARRRAAHTTRQSLIAKGVSPCP